MIWDCEWINITFSTAEVGERDGYEAWLVFADHASRSPGQFVREATRRCSVCQGGWEASSLRYRWCLRRICSLLPLLPFSRKASRHHISARLLILSFTRSTWCTWRGIKGVCLCIGDRCWNGNYWSVVRVPRICVHWMKNMQRSCQIAQLLITMSKAASSCGNELPHGWKLAGCQYTPARNRPGKDINKRFIKYILKSFDDKKQMALVISEYSRHEDSLNPPITWLINWV